MIVIDTSALIAILNHEPERTVFYVAIAASDRRLVSAVTYQEAGQVMFARRGVNGLYDLEDLLSLIKAEIISHDLNLAALSLEAFRRDGRRLRRLRARQGNERAVAVQRRRFHRN